MTLSYHKKNFYFNSKKFNFHHSVYDLTLDFKILMFFLFRVVSIVLLNFSRFYLHFLVTRLR